MKIITVILSILIVFLSANPCSDEYCEEQDTIDEIEFNNNHQDNTNESCPITCVCNCCGMSITFEHLKPYSFQSKPDISTLLFSDYLSHYRFSLLGKIWQPPQDIIS